MKEGAKESMKSHMAGWDERTQAWLTGNSTVKDQNWIARLDKTEARSLSLRRIYSDTKSFVYIMAFETKYRWLKPESTIEINLIISNESNKTCSPILSLRSMNPRQR